MKKRKKPSARRRASIGIALCFVAAVVIAGTYTLTNYRKSGQQDEQEQQADSTKKKDSNSMVSTVLDAGTACPFINTVITYGNNTIIIRYEPSRFNFCSIKNPPIGFYERIFCFIQHCI